MGFKPPKKDHPWHGPYKGDKRRTRTPPATSIPAKRRVFVTLEIETDAPLEELRKANYWSFCGLGKVLQSQANVAQT